MSLDTIEYITFPEYQKNISIDDNSTQIHIPDIQNYFKLKNDYMALLKQVEKKSTIKKIFGITNTEENGGTFKTNLPLQFIEGDGVYIINVIDDITKEIQYSKKIQIPKSIIVKDRLDFIVNKLDKLNYTTHKNILYNKLENIRRTQSHNTVLLENNLISQELYNNRNKQIEQEIAIVKQEYNRLKIDMNDLYIELGILHKLILQQIENKQRIINQFVLDKNIMSVELNTVFNKIIKEFQQEDLLEDNLYSFHTLDRIINQSKELYKGDLVRVISTSNPNSSKLGVIYSYTDTDSELTILYIDSRKRENVSKDRIISIQGIRSLIQNYNQELDLYSIPYAEYVDKLKTVGVNIAEETTEIDIRNIVKKTGLTKKKVVYASPIKKEKKSTKVTVKKQIQDIDITIEPSNINIIEDSKLYNSPGDVLMFYSMSKQAAAGSGSREKIISEDKYLELNNISDWRRKLSNFWIHRDREGKTVPIVIDGNRFLTVEHYFHYSKFWNISNIAGKKKQQYDDYAMKFTYDYEGDGWGKLNGNVAKQKGGRSSGMEHREDWFSPVEGISKEILEQKYQQGGGNSISLRDYILLKGIYAKFKQFNDLADCLMYTNDSLLIHPLEGNIRSGKNEIAFHHLYVRYLLRNNKPLILYEQEQSDALLSQSQSIADPIIESSKQSKSQESTKMESETSREQHVKTIKELLDKKGLDTSVMSISEMFKQHEQLIKQESLQNAQELSREIEKLNDVLMQVHNKAIYPIPPDGDCGYYSIVEMAAKQNIYPLNFSDGEEEGQYSSEQTLQETSVSEESNKSMIYHKAMLELRRDIANKLKDNLIVGEVQSEPIEVLKQSIVIDFNKNLPYNSEVEELKFNSIYYSYNNILGTKGAWISEDELRIASALLNINIKVYLSNGSITEYKAADNTVIFNKGLKYNQGSVPKTIELAYYSNYHYVGVVKRVSLLATSKFGKPIEYYVTPIILNDDPPYMVAFEYENHEVDPLGIYDKDKSTITYFKYDEDSKDDDIVDALTEKLDSIELNSITNDSNYTKISYYVDQNTGLVYLKPTINSPSIGHIETITSEDSDEEESYIKIVFI